MLDVLKLSCARGDRILFRELSFSLTTGAWLHVTGRNGSGKTTLLRTVCGLTRPLDGKIQWRGTNVHALGDDYRAQLAYVGHLNGFQGELTPVENLAVITALRERASTAQIENALERMSLSAYRSFPAKILSQGQKRRLALARLFILDRPLWVLDEPLSALDTDSAIILSEAISRHLDNGGAAIVTSHQALNLAKPAQRILSLDS